MVGRGGRYIEGIVAVYDTETDYAFIVDLPRVVGEGILKGA